MTKMEWLVVAVCLLCSANYWFNVRKGVDKKDAPGVGNGIEMTEDYAGFKIRVIKIAENKYRVVAIGKKYAAFEWDDDGRGPYQWVERDDFKVSKACYAKARKMAGME